jgi:hypothetical protein
MFNELSVKDLTCDLVPTFKHCDLSGFNIKSLNKNQSLIADKHWHNTEIEEDLRLIHKVTSSAYAI